MQDKIVETDKPLLGALLFIAFGVLCTMSDGVAKYLISENKISPHLIVFYRHALLIFILYPFVRKQIKNKLNIQQIKATIIASLFLIGASTSYFWLLQFGKLTEFAAISFITPITTTILSVIFLKEKCSTILTLALMLGLAGAAIILKPFDASFNIFLLAGLGSMFLYSAYSISVKKLTKILSPMLILYYISILVSLILMPTVTLFEFVLPQNSQDWLLSGIAILLMISGHISLIKAYQYASVSFLAPFDYLSIITASIFAYFVFGEIISLNTILGSVVIFYSGYLVLRQAKARKKKRILEYSDKIRPK